MRQSFVFMALTALAFCGAPTLATAHTGLGGDWELNYPTNPSGVAAWTFTEDILNATFTGTGSYTNAEQQVVNVTTQGTIYADEFYVGVIQGIPNKRALAIFGVALPNLGGIVIESSGIFDLSIVILDGHIVHASSTKPKLKTPKKK